MVLLKEDSVEPAATVSTTEIPSQTLRQLIEANQMLTLPRLSSQVNYKYFIIGLPPRLSSKVNT